VLHQLRHVVGDAAFFQILADYRAAYAYSAADTDQFAAVASSSWGQDLTWFFDQWVYQIGAPHYQFGWDSVDVNGQYYLLLYLNQVQGPTYPPVFIMPVDVVATIGAGDELVTVWNDAQTQWFAVPVSGSVTALGFDPDEWILRTGAQGVVYVPGPPKIVVTDPVPGAVLRIETQQDTVTIAFQTNVDALPSDFELVGAAGGPQSFTIADTTNVNPIVLELDGPLVPDGYTLTIADRLVATDSQLALDGEMVDPEEPDSLPSGDGVPGGIAAIQFVVRGSPIPAVSQWGLVVMALLALAGGTLVFRRARPASR
jgi:hypothetical protein